LTQTVRQCESKYPTDEIACWWEETKISTHLRLAAGICVLTTGLLIGSAGGAIATADTESSGSTSQSQGAGESTQSVNTANAPTASSTEPATTKTPQNGIRTALLDVLQKIRTLGKVQQQPVKKPADPVTADKPDGAEGDVGGAVTEPLAQSDVDVVASETYGAASDSNDPAPAIDPVPPVPPAAPGPPPVVTVSNVLEPVTNAIARVAGAALAVPVVFASLPTSPTPVADVITAVQNILIAVNDAIAPIVQLPSDFVSLLVAAGMSATPVDSIGNSAGARLSDATGPAPVLPFMPMVPPVPPNSPVGVMPLLGDVTAPVTLGGLAAAGLSADLSLSGTAPLTADGAGPTGALSLLEHTVRAFLAPASLSALAALALPGIAGLLIVCAAGMRVGYRQAKAALAVRTTGISRFARQGPLGVVRSGSLVTLHPRSSGPRHSRPRRVVRPDVSRAAPLLEQVA
jgi:hypothetical protein